MLAPDPPTPQPLIVETVVGGHANGNAYAVLDVRAVAGAVLPPHVTSREDGALLVIDGQLEVVVGADRRTAGPGEVVTLPRNQPHRIAVLVNARLLCLVVPAGIEMLADAIGDPTLDRDDLAALLAAAGVSLLPTGWGAPVPPVEPA